MNETTFKPMDDIRLRFYYALMSYSLGLISFVSIQKPLLVLVIDLFIITLTPLTLLISDKENIYIELSIVILFPILTLLLGIFKGYVITKLYDYYFHKKDETLDKSGDEQQKKNYKKCNNIAHYCKAGLIAATIMCICIFYFIDLTVPLLVSWGYPNFYLKLRFCLHLGLSVFLIGLALGFKQKRFAKLWMMVAYSTSTILLTTLFIFNIIKSNGYMVYLVFFVHFTLVVITLPMLIIILHRFGYKVIIKRYGIPLFDNFKSKYENVDNSNDSLQLNTFNTDVTIDVKNE